MFDGVSSERDAFNNLANIFECTSGSGDHGRFSNAPNVKAIELAGGSVLFLPFAV